MTNEPQFSANIRPEFPALCRGSGAYFWDVNGKEYVDFSSQTLNLALGHCPPAVIEAIQQQAARLHFTSGRFLSDIAYRLRDELLALAPRGMDRLHLRLCNGTDAVESAVKIARRVTGRCGILVVEGAWHGESMVTLSASSDFSSHLDVCVDPGYLIVPDSRNSNPIDQLSIAVEQNAHRVAAALVDPLLVAKGMPTQRSELSESLSRLRATCTRAGVLLIFDEIQSFGGWLSGELFAAEYFKTVPDIVVLGKAFGAGLPLAAVLHGQDLDGVLLYNEAEFTSGGQPIACAAALAAIRQTISMRTHIHGLEAALDCHIVDGLSSIHNVRTRRIGTLVAVEPVDISPHRQHRVKRWYSELLDLGVLTRVTNRGATLLLKVPIVCEAEVVERAASIIFSVVRSIDARFRVPPGDIGGAINEVRCTSNRVLRRPRPGVVDVLGYVGDIWSVAVGVQGAVGLSLRSLETQLAFASRLVEVGVPCAEHLCVNADGWLEVERLDGPLVSDAVKWSSDVVLEYLRTIATAHSSGILIGDRWGQNAIVTESGVKHFDFDIEVSLGPETSLVAALAAEFAIASFFCAAHAEGHSEVCSRIVEVNREYKYAELAKASLLRICKHYRSVNRKRSPSSLALGAYMRACAQLFKAFGVNAHLSV